MLLEINQDFVSDQWRWILKETEQECKPFLAVEACERVVDLPLQSSVESCQSLDGHGGQGY